MMNQEIDPKNVVEGAERLIEDLDSRFIGVRLAAPDFINLGSLLMMMRELRRRQVVKDSVGEADEDALSSLQSRFFTRERGNPELYVELDISFREISVLGDALPLIEQLLKFGKRYGFPLSKESEKLILVMTHEAFISLFDSFVEHGGKDDQDLRQRVNTWAESLNKQ